MNSNDLTIGTRFTLYGSEYEIVNIQYGKIRYSAVAGGRTFTTNCQAFDELCSNGNLIIIFNSRSEFTEPEKSLQIIFRKKHYVEAAIRFLVKPTARKPLMVLIKRIAEEINDIKAPGVSTVAKWIKAYQERKDKGLEVRRKSGNQTFRFDPIVEQLINKALSEVYLVPERRTAEDVRAYIVGQLMEMNLLSDSTIKIPCNRTICRRIKRLDQYVVVKAKKGALAAQRYAQSAGQKFNSTSVLSMVQIDTHYMDVLVIDAETGELLGRPYLTCIFCIYTRMVVGINICLLPPSAITFLAALKDMLICYGVPSMIIPDNGAELKNTTFSAVCETLCITISRAQVKDPNGKAHLESFFRSLTYGIVQKIPGTTFSNPKQRGSYDSEKRAVLTLCQVREIAKEWISEIYHKSIHSRTGRAPILLWEDEIKNFPPLKLPEIEVDRIARKRVTRTIHNGRLQINYIEYFSHSLAGMSGEKVTALVDELNLDSIYILHPRDNSISIKCESTDPEYTQGLSVYEHDEARKLRASVSRADLLNFGRHAGLASRYLLLNKIHSLDKAGRKLKRKVMNGKVKGESIQSMVEGTGPKVTSDSFGWSLHNKIIDLNTEDETYSSTEIEYEI